MLGLLLNQDITDRAEFYFEQENDTHKKKENKFKGVKPGANPLDLASPKVSPPLKRQTRIGKKKMRKTISQVYFISPSMKTLQHKNEAGWKTKRQKEPVRCIFSHRFLVFNINIS